MSHKKPEETRRERQKKQREQRRVYKRDSASIPVIQKGNTHQSKSKQTVILEPLRVVPFTEVGVGNSFIFTMEELPPRNAAFYVKDGRFHYRDGQVQYRIIDLRMECMEYAKKLSQNG